MVASKQRVIGFTEEDEVSIASSEEVEFFESDDETEHPVDGDECDDDGEEEEEEEEDDDDDDYEEENEDDDDYEEENEDDDDYEEEEIIRGKWCMDGAKTIDEAIEKLREMIEYLEELKGEGWELIDEIDDDYGFLRKTSENVAGERTKDVVTE
jgi:hypothetical protein